MITASSSTTPGGIHRYFPDWAHLPKGSEPLREADRNSYLAGGYADEFGYGMQDGVAAMPPLDGDPESSSSCVEQVGALHPGYPRCPKPVDRIDTPDARSLRPAPRPAQLHAAVVAFRAVAVRRQRRASLRDLMFRIGLLAFLAERLIRHRHLSDVR